MGSALATPTQGFPALCPAVWGLPPAVPHCPGWDMGCCTPQLLPPLPPPRMASSVLPGSPLPVDTGLGLAEPSSVAWGLQADRGAPCTVVSSAERGRQSPTLGREVRVVGSKVLREDTRSLHTDVQEADREQEPPSLSS